VKLPKGMFRRGLSYYTRIRTRGRDRWISLGRDYEAAKEALSTRSAESKTATVLTVAEAVEQWLSGYVRTARNEKGGRLARSRARLHLLPFMRNRMIGDVESEDVRRYRLWLEGKELAPQTVSNVLCDARCFFSWSVEAGLSERSPFPRRLMPRIQERLPNRLTREEVALLVEVPEPFGFVVRLGLATGLRWGELCRALPGDIHRDALHVSQTKSGKVRRIPISPALLKELRGRAGRLVPFREADPGNFSWHVRRHSGVERFHPHMMRHTFACEWIEHGGSLPALQQLLGHASISTTQRYARLGDDVVREQAKRTWENQTVANSVAGEASK
jgi:integrase